MSLRKPPWPAVGLSLACAVVLWLVYAPGFWVADDWLYFMIAHTDGPFSRGWLDSVYFQHWAPLHRLSISLALETGASYRLVLAVTVLALCASGPFLVDVLDRLFGRRPAHLVALVAYLLSALFVSVLNWWSAALQMVPSAVSAVVVLWAYLRWREDRRDRWLVLIALALSLGLLFYIRALLIPVYLLAVRMLLLERSPSPRTLWRALVDERRVVVALALPVVPYVVHYLGLGTGGTSQGASLWEYVQFCAIAWGRVLVPGLLGAWVPKAVDADTFQTAFVVLGQLLVLAAVVVTVVRRRSAWRGWALLLVVVAGNFALVAVPRVPPNGPSIAYSPRYFSDVALLLPVALLAAWSGAPALRGEVVRRLRVPRRPVLVLAGAAGVAYLVLTLSTAGVLNGQWTARQNRDWRSELVRTLGGGAGRDAVLAQERLPGFVLNTQPPYDRLSTLLGATGLPVATGGPLDGRRLVRLTEGGAAEPAHFEPSFATDAVEGLRTGRLVASGAGRVVVRGRAACLAASATEAASLAVRPPTPVAATPVFLEVGGSAASPVSLPVRTTAQAGEELPAGPTTSVDLAPGGTRFLSWLNIDRVGAVRIDVPAGAEACFTSVAVGGVALDEGQASATSAAPY